MQNYPRQKHHLQFAGLSWLRQLKAVLRDSSVSHMQNDKHKQLVLLAGQSLKILLVPLLVHLAARKWSIRSSTAVPIILGDMLRLKLLITMKDT